MERFLSAMKTTSLKGSATEQLLFIYLLQTRSPYKNTNTDAKKIVIVPQKKKKYMGHMNV